ncbi:membrane protein [Mesorhizobium sp. L-8-10]|uniref:anthrone oxygenase family protein n=1 Tax=Mesorhizobium sp. L-8-10 TaxID=2744523 RepID=UPI001925E97F|nr:anthrone oxygenase family protein [Mesorhizobium sp. L-8-10]BCH30210.1 membrane protein [Mesorhizobium sp. L-8-10]
MTGTLLVPLVFFAALGSGLAAGVFFAFSTFVMSGLARLPAPSGIAAMNAINVTAVTPVFMSLLFGTALVAAVIGVLAVMNWSTAGTAYALAGALLYLVGVIVVTIAFNVPLNDQLAAVAPDSAAGAEFWQHYLAAWVGWNHVRTLAPLGSLALFILAMRT